MKKILLLSLLISFVFISCKKDDEDDGPLVIEKIEYHIDTNVDNSMIKYINANGGEELVLIGKDSTWVYSFAWKKELHSVGFKLKDYITWVTYKIVVNEDTVVNYTGVVPEGGYAGWYDVYYMFD